MKMYEILKNPLFHATIFPLETPNESIFKSNR